MAINPPIIPKSHLASDFHFSPNKNEVQNRITKEMDSRPRGGVMCSPPVSRSSPTAGRGAVQGESRRAPFELVAISSWLGDSNRWHIVLFLVGGATCYFLNLFYWNLFRKLGKKCAESQPAWHYSGPAAGDTVERGSQGWPGVGSDCLGLGRVSLQSCMYDVARRQD